MTEDIIKRINIVDEDTERLMSLYLAKRKKNAWICKCVLSYSKTHGFKIFFLKRRVNISLTIKGESRGIGF